MRKLAINSENTWSQAKIKHVIKSSYFKNYPIANNHPAVTSGSNGTLSAIKIFSKK